MINERQFLSIGGANRVETTAWQGSEWKGSHMADEEIKDIDENAEDIDENAEDIRNFQRLFAKLENRYVLDDTIGFIGEQNVVNWVVQNRGYSVIDQLDHADIRAFLVETPKLLVSAVGELYNRCRSAHETVDGLMAANEDQIKRHEEQLKITGEHLRALRNRVTDDGISMDILREKIEGLEGEVQRLRDIIRNTAQTMQGGL